MAKERVTQIAFPPEAEIGGEYDGKVVNITKFGAFVNILPGRDGLLHISRLDGSKRVERVEDYLSDGDELKVRVREIERGKVSLELVEPLPGATLPSSEAPSGGGGGGRDRGDRDRGRGRDSRGGDRGGDRGNRSSGNSGSGNGIDRSPNGDAGNTSHDTGTSSDQETGSGRRKAAQPFSEAFEQMQD